jgi:hypothetical protein
MGWQRRGSRSYFYLPRRSGGRPTHRYIGRGEAAELIAEQHEAEQVAKLEARQLIRAARERVGPIEDLTKRLDEHADLLLEGTLRAAGFSRQCRKWRGRRHGRRAVRSC